MLLIRSMDTINITQSEIRNITVFIWNTVTYLNTYIIVWAHNVLIGTKADTVLVRLLSPLRRKVVFFLVSHTVHLLFVLVFVLRCKEILKVMLAPFSASSLEIECTIFVFMCLTRHFFFFERVGYCVSEYSHLGNYSMTPPRSFLVGEKQVSWNVWPRMFVFKPRSSY